MLRDGRAVGVAIESKEGGGGVRVYLGRYRGGGPADNVGWGIGVGLHVAHKYHSTVFFFLYVGVFCVLGR